MDKSVDDMALDELINHLDEEFSKRRLAMGRIYGRWLVNERFYRGDHWVSWDHNLRQLVDYYSDLARDHDMSSVNRVGEYTTIMANLLSSGKPEIGPMPPTQSEEHVSAAKICKYVLKHVDRINDTEELNRKLRLWSLLYGTVIKLLDWDGENVVEELIHPREILPRMDSKGDFDQCIRYRFVELDLIKEKFGKRAKNLKSESPSAQDASDVFFGNQHEKYKNPVIFKEWWRQGSKKYPEGRYLVWANGVPLIEDVSHLQDSGGEVPLIRYAYKESAPPDFWGIAYVDWLIPINVKINKALTLANDYLGRATRLWIAVENFSEIDIDAIMSDPKMIVAIPFNRGSIPPQPIALPNLSIDIWKYIDILELQMMDMAHVHHPTKGIAPPNQRTASGLAMLREQDEGPLYMPVENFKQGEVRAAQMKLHLAKRYPDGMMLRIVGPDNTVHVESFSKAAILDEIDVIAEPESGMPSSRAMQQTWLMELFRVNGLEGIEPNKRARLIREMMHFNSIDVIFKDDEQAKAQAMAEEDALRNGEQIDVYYFENHPIHRQQHQGTILSKEFADWGPHEHAALLQHETKHKAFENIMIQEQMQQMQGPQPTEAQVATQELAEAKL